MSHQLLFCLVHLTAYCCRHYFLCSKIFILHTPSFQLPLQLSDHSILTSQSVSHLSLSFLCIILLILDKLKLEMTKDPLHHAGKNGSISMGRTCIMLQRMGSTPAWRISMEIISTHTTSTSLVVPIRAYKRFNIFAILSIASFLFDLNIKPQRYMNTSQRGTSSQNNTWTTLMHSAPM